MTRMNNNNKNKTKKKIKIVLLKTMKMMLLNKIRKIKNNQLIKFMTIIKKKIAIKTTTYRQIGK